MHDRHSADCCHADCLYGDGRPDGGTPAPLAPYILLCAFVANVGSLALPISNLTNLIFADAFHQTFAAFAARMILPQLVALVTTYAILRR
jgi:Na+/H+ antiporter NhaD/arsenite permease-like protein